jgi:hypothetical protein
VGALRAVDNRPHPSSRVRVSRLRLFQGAARGTRPRFGVCPRLIARSLALVALMFNSLGCFGVGTPPLRASVGGTGRAADDGYTSSADQRADWRVGVYPTQLIRPLRSRLLDVGLGYLNQPGHPPVHEAAFVEVTVPVLHHWIAENAEWRMGLGAQGRLAYEAGSGFGGALQVTAERLAFMKEHGCLADFFTGAFGDLGVGLYAEAAFERVESKRIWSTSAGLSFRLPAAGILSIEHAQCGK